MKHWGWTLPLALLAAPAPAPAANKCVETSGRVFYQAAPCPPNTRGGDLSLNVNRPFTGQAQRPVPAEAAVTSGRAAAPSDPEPDHDGRLGQDAERQPGER
jgi:hypothetical protein